MDELHERASCRASTIRAWRVLRTLVAELVSDARIVVTLRFQEDLDTCRRSRRSPNHACQHGEESPAALDGRASPQAEGQRARI